MEDTSACSLQGPPGAKIVSYIWHYLQRGQECNATTKSHYTYVTVSKLHELEALVCQRMFTKPRYVLLSSATMQTPIQIIPWHSMLALATRNEQGRESPWVQLLKLFFQVYTCRNVGLCIYLVQKICWLHQFWSEGIKADVGSLLVPVKSLR